MHPTRQSLLLPTMGAALALLPLATHAVDVVQAEHRVDVNCTGQVVTEIDTGATGELDCRFDSGMVVQAATAKATAYQGVSASAKAYLNEEPQSAFAQGAASVTYYYRVTQQSSPPSGSVTVPFSIRHGLFTACSPMNPCGRAGLTAGFQFAPVPFLDVVAPPNVSAVYRGKVSPGTVVRVGLIANCVATAATENAINSRICSSWVDPVIELDQETFDAEMGDDTFPLADYFVLELSEGVENPVRTVEPFDPHPLQTDDTGLPDPEDPGATVFRVTATGGATAEDPTVASAAGTLASSAGIVAEGESLHFALGSRAGATGTRDGTEGFVLRAEFPGRGGNEAAGPLHEFFAQPRDLSEFGIHVYAREATGNGATQLRVALRDSAGVVVTTEASPLTQGFEAFGFVTSAFSEPAAPGAVFDVTHVEDIGIEFFTDPAESTEAMAFEFHLDDIALVPEPFVAMLRATALVTLGALAARRTHALCGTPL